MSALEFPERPAGVGRPAADSGRRWAAVWAIPIAIGALVAGGVTYAAAAALRGMLTNLPDHQDGVVGVALHGAPPLLTFAGTLAQDLALVAGAVVAAAAALGGRVTAAHLGLKPARVVSAAAFVAGGYLVFVLIAAAWTSALGVTDHENVAIDLGTRDSAAAFVGVALLVCVVAPICEELFFRGFLFGALRHRGIVLATVVSAAGFGLAHAASAPLGFIVPLAALGAILALLYERTGSLYPSIALHALNNSIAFGVGDGRAWAIPICLAAAGLIIFLLSRAVRGHGAGRHVAPTS